MYLGASLLTVALVFYQIYLGSQLVWLHGLHVKPVAEAPAVAPTWLDQLQGAVL